jgi:hypothetical protein
MFIYHEGFVELGLRNDIALFFAERLASASPTSFVIEASIPSSASVCVVCCVLCVVFLRRMAVL